MFFNKSKRQMYFLLNDFNKTNDFKLSMNNTKDKFKIDDYTLGFRINECVTNHFINGIHSDATASNRYICNVSEHIFITYNGYEFLTNYYSFIKKILWELLIIIVTATITVIINNKLSNDNQITNITDNVASQDFVSSEICNYTNN